MMKKGSRHRGMNEEQTKHEKITPALKAARRDVLPFVYAHDRPSVDLWSRDFFTTLVEKMPWRN